jgi:hypothetical protein
VDGPVSTSSAASGIAVSAGVNILVGHDAETWDMGVTIPLGTIHELLAGLGEPPEVTPPPFGPTLF